MNSKELITAKEARQKIIKQGNTNGIFPDIIGEIDYGIEQGWTFIETTLRLGSYEKALLKEKGYSISSKDAGLIFIISWC